MTTNSHKIYILPLLGSKNITAFDIKLNIGLEYWLIVLLYYEFLKLFNIKIAY